ncbi:MAG TPA: polysaccharide biosynthesis/export family protein [Phycisphaerae bacterium]|nr:polysaccharide biosynthesis/export family protein [Phycisphaerae bacterium]
MRLHLISLTGAGLALVLAAGCAKPKYADLRHFVQANDQDVGDSNYRINPPDIVAISSPSCPEVDNEIQQVRSDGKLSLRLLGEVKVSGLTPRELAAKIEDLLKRYYTSPKVNVQVAGYESQKIYIFGQVSRGGKLPYTGLDTILDVLAKAGPTSLAWGAQVKVIRPSAAPDERHEIIVDVDKIMQSGDLQSNFLLKEGDIVYVPPTPLAWVGLRVRELLWPFEPVMTGYDYTVRTKDAPDRWKYGEYGYRYDSNDNDNWRRQQMLFQLMR